MGREEIRRRLVELGVQFDEVDFLSQFWGTRFSFKKRELRKIDKDEKLRPLVKANFKDWCIEVF